MKTLHFVKNDSRDDVAVIELVTAQISLGDDVAMLKRREMIQKFKDNKNGKCELDDSDFEQLFRWMTSPQAFKVMLGDFCLDTITMLRQAKDTKDAKQDDK